MSRGAHSIEPTSGGPRPETSAATDPWLLDSREVSRVLGIGRTKVFQMMARAELPVVRIGRCVRVPHAALRAWVEEQIASAGVPSSSSWRSAGRQSIGRSGRP